MMKSFSFTLFLSLLGVANAAQVPSVTGDPHFTMFNGNKYDFHGACDLIFLENPDFNHGQGIKVHIRTKIQRWWSYVESAVVQIGADRLEVMAGFDGKNYWVNGERGPKVTDTVKDTAIMPFTIGGFQVRFRVINDHEYQFKIFFGKESEKKGVVMRSVKDLMRVDLMEHTEENFGHSRGLLGTYGEGLMLARDGATIMEDPIEFGMEWQVHSDDGMLFHDVSGPQYPQACAMPEVSQSQRRLGGAVISSEEAANACKSADPLDWDDCIMDVIAMGDIQMAGAF